MLYKTVYSPKGREFKICLKCNSWIVRKVGCDHGLPKEDKK